ncbi:MAG TPA: V-type ATP synthase subunit A [Sulfolobales archaeon]|nr:V-type ATP synthase subunit A [Sulfolobales archaeon]
MRERKGRIIRISGSLVVAEGLPMPQMYEVAEVGEQRLVGEIVRIDGDRSYIQVYESTSGLRPGEPVYGTGSPLSVELGPGLIGQIFDGIQRPLKRIADTSKNIFVLRGIKLEAVPRDRKHMFTPSKELKPGDKVGPGDIIGYVDETPLIRHWVMIPHGVSGRLIEISPEGEYGVEDPIAYVEADGEKIAVRMLQRWPARRPRPFKEKLEPELPMLTGMRILDTLFPMAKGGTGAIPGGFGTGKTVTLHSLAMWSDARVVIYIGCGERGNEMTEVLEKFPTYKDPWSGRPLMERTILIANTSNMPVSAREASIYVGVTMAEYYRDMGYDVLLVADSTSRWAEALREIAGRLEEMPAEEGYPSYLQSRLAEFYERAGRVIAVGEPKRIGSVTLVGAVSPPGADFTEPVTTHTRRFIRVFWALDTALAYSRHYPAINWITSYSAYVDTVTGWWAKNVDKDWRDLRDSLYSILLRENELREIVRLIGPENLSEPDKLVMEAARIIREGFLKQNAYDKIDAFASPQKQVKLMRAMVNFYRNAKKLVDSGVPVKVIREKTQDLITELIKARFTIPNEELDKLGELDRRITERLSQIGG